MKLVDRLTNKIWRTLYLPKASVSFGNKRFLIPRFSFHHFYKSNLESEPWLYQLLKTIHQHKPINQMIDIGVNLGQTLLKIKAINKSVSYLGFEPNPYCCSFLEQVVSANTIDSTTIVPCGLSDINRLAKLKVKSNNLTDSSATIIDKFRGSKEEERYQYVSTYRLDDVLPELDHSLVDLIKIDVEGAELEVIKGMQVVLNEHQPIIILEVLPPYNAENEFRIQRQNELSEIFSQLKYSLYQIIKNTSNIKLVELVEFPIHDKVMESDYILLPNSINPEDLGLTFFE